MSPTDEAEHSNARPDTTPAPPPMTLGALAAAAPRPSDPTPEPAQPDHPAGQAPAETDRRTATVAVMELPTQNAAPAPEKVDSTSDDRTKNNLMRHQYRVLSDDEKKEMQDIKDMGLVFAEALHLRATRGGGMTRELALALTNIEQAVMWAVKDLTR